MSTPKISTFIRPLCRLDGRSLDLGAVHDAARGGIERVPAVKRAAVVPQDQVVALPDLPESEFWLRRVRPQPVEQRLAFGEVEPDDIAVATSSEEERGPLRF